MAHAFFAPSSLPRVVRCPGSVLLTLGMPDTQTKDAAHGTAAHWIADLALRNKKHVDHYAGCVVAVHRDGRTQFVHDGNRDELTTAKVLGDVLTFEVDDEMVVAVQEYVDWCNAAPGEKYPECRVDISRWTPKPKDDLSNLFTPPEAFEPQFGTSDHAACSPGRLIITDLKYGKGVMVFAERNEQAVAYALGFIDEWDWLYDFQEIEIRICQPRLDHKDVWVCTRAELEEIGRYILERTTLSLRDDAPFNPGEKQCKFCKANGLCRAQAEHLSSMRALAFDDLTETFEEPDPRLLTQEELVEAWRMHKWYKARFEAIAREILQGEERGEEFPGVKVVESHTKRRWRNEAAVIEEFCLDVPEDVLVKRKLLSPNQLSKKLPKAQRAKIDDLTIRPVGKPCIVDVKDKRPRYKDAVAGRHADAFDNLDAEDEEDED